MSVGATRQAARGSSAAARAGALRRRPDPARGAARGDRPQPVRPRDARRDRHRRRPPRRRAWSTSSPPPTSRARSACRSGSRSRTRRRRRPARTPSWPPAACATSGSRSRSWWPTAATAPRTRSWRCSPSTSRCRPSSTSTMRWRTARRTCSPSLGSNVVGRIRQGAVEDAAFAGAAVDLEAVLEIGRHFAVPMECRGIVAEYDPRRGLTVWGPAKRPHATRDAIARFVGLDEHEVHVIEPDVGGGFGARGELYPEDLLVPWLAIRTGRPVAWIEDRREHLTTTNHSREQRHRARIAVGAGRAHRGAARPSPQQPGCLRALQRAGRDRAVRRPAARAVPDPRVRGGRPLRRRQHDADRRVPSARALRGHVRARAAARHGGAPAGDGPGRDPPAQRDRARGDAVRGRYARARVGHGVRHRRSRAAARPGRRGDRLRRRQPRARRASRAAGCGSASA